MLRLLVVDASIFEALQDLLGRMDASPSLRVVSYSKARTPRFTFAALVDRQDGEHHDCCRGFGPP